MGYARAMNENASTGTPAHSVEDVLESELAYGNVALGTIGPVMGHLLVNHDKGLFGDETVATVRGMIGHVAQQLYGRQDAGNEGQEPQVLDDIVARLSGHVGLISHCHARAMEWQLSRRLEARSGIDPVLTPMIQALVASSDATTSSTAMSLIAAQARFGQQMQRMELPIAELPEELAREIRETIQNEFDLVEKLPVVSPERANRLHLLSSMLRGAGVDRRDGLKISNAGVALFLTAMAETSNQQRDLAILATNERQLARLALALRAGGLKPAEIEEQFLILHPEVTLPDGFETLRPDRAESLLANGNAGQHG